jgi:hypothetical protein
VRMRQPRSHPNPTRTLHMGHAAAAYDVGSEPVMPAPAGENERAAAVGVTDELGPDQIDGIVAGAAR